MIDVRMCFPVAPSDVVVVSELAARALAVDGHPSLGDAVWRDLQAPSARTVLFLASDADAGQVVGALHAIQADADRSVTAAMVVHPDRRDTGVATALLHEWLSVLVRHGPRHVALWVFGADDRADSLAAAAGLERERELWQMRVPLPIGEDPRWPDGVAVRPFSPGADEAAWVVLNNRAFASDPDQGGWSEDRLRALEREPWFDASGFLLATDGRRIAGFCWTKLHPALPPHEPDALGEIYVIGVDPDHQGTGLGRALVVGGLASLHDRGAPVGMLFVDASNAPATGLYRALGFDVSRVDRAYGRELT